MVRSHATKPPSLPAAGPKIYRV